MKKIIIAGIAAIAAVSAFASQADMFFTSEVGYTTTKLIRVNSQARQAVIQCGSPDKHVSGPAKYRFVPCYKLDFSIPDGMMPSKSEVNGRYLHSHYTHSFTYGVKY